jgi:hypothetical protein
MASYPVGYPTAEIGLLADLDFSGGIRSGAGQTAFWWVGLRGLEPLTSSLSGKRSNRLSYRPRARCLRWHRRGRLPHEERGPQTGPLER